MKPNPRGKDGEDLAADILLRKGYSILCRNFHAKFGEIDIIALKDEVIAFIEVKARKRGSLITGLESVTYSKRRKISLTAQYFLITNPQLCDLQPRFDIISIATGVSGKNTVADHTHLEGAFDYDG